MASGCVGFTMTAGRIRGNRDFFAAGTPRKLVRSFSFELRQVVRDLLPRRFRCDMDMRLGPDARILVDRPGRNQHAIGIVDVNGHGRTAATTKRHRHMRGCRILEMDQVFRTRNPAEPVARDKDVGRKWCAARLPAIGAMAMHHPVRQTVELVTHGPAQTAATNRTLGGGRAGFTLDGNTRIVGRKFVELRCIVGDVEPTRFVGHEDVAVERSCNITIQVAGWNNGQLSRDGSHTGPAPGAERPLPALRRLVVANLLCSGHPAKPIGRAGDKRAISRSMHLSADRAVAVDEHRKFTVNRPFNVATQAASMIHC